MFVSEVIGAALLFNFPWTNLDQVRWFILWPLQVFCTINKVIYSLVLWGGGELCYLSTIDIRCIHDFDSALLIGTGTSLLVCMLHLSIAVQPPSFEF